MRLNKSNGRKSVMCTLVLCVLRVASQVLRCDGKEATGCVSCAADGVDSVGCPHGKFS